MGKQSRQEHSPIECIFYRLPNKNKMSLTEECMAVYNNILESKSLRYAIFTIEEGRVVVETTADLNGPHSTYADFLATIIQNHVCKYGLFMYTFQPEGAGTTIMSGLLLISWIPDNLPIEKRIFYTSNFETLKEAFVGVDVKILATDADYLEQGVVERSILTL